MNEFMMIFRAAGMMEMDPTPEELQAMLEQWQSWIGNIAANGAFVSTNQLGFQGKTVKPGGVITDGPYAEVKEMVGGYIIVKAPTLDDAVAMAHGCPILLMGGHVEVRDVMAIEA
jgi:hypothetical protein